MSGRRAGGQEQGLRGAIRWLIEQPRLTPAAIESASARFGLSPIDSAVLYRYFSPSFEPDLNTSDQQFKRDF